MEICIIFSASRSQHPFGLLLYVTYHFFLNQVQGKTNDREEIFDCILQLFLNYFHINLHFLLHPTQCRWTLTWRWCSLWSPLHHTVIHPSFSESRWGNLLSWVLGRSSTRTPWFMHQFDSVRWSNWFPNTIDFLQDSIGSCPISSNTASIDLDIDVLTSSTVQQACRISSVNLQSQSDLYKLSLSDQWSTFLSHRQIVL